MKYELSREQQLFVEKSYRDDIIYQWLRCPCMKHSADDTLMYPEVLYYVCMQVLDLTKRYGCSCDSRVSEQLRCLPYEMREFFHVVNSEHYAEVGCYNACMILITLSKLLGFSMDDNLQDYSKTLKTMADEFPMVSRWGKNVDIKPYIQRLEKEYNDLSIINNVLFIEEALHRKHCGTDVNIREYVDEYLLSDRSISEEIEEGRLSDGVAEEAVSAELEAARTKISELEACVKELEGKLKEKESMLESEKDEDHYEKICIANRKKTKLEVLLVGLYYADYFVTEGGTKVSLKKTISPIMEKGFHSQCNRLSKDISQYIATNCLDVFKDDLVKQFKEALDDIKKVQR